MTEKIESNEINFNLLANEFDENFREILCVDSGHGFRHHSGAKLIEETNKFKGWNL